MPELSVLAWAALALGAIAVGVSKSAIPGVNTLSIVLFAAVLPARESTGALLVLLMLGDVGAVWTYRKRADWRILRRLAPAVLAGLALGVGFLAIADDRLMALTIGIILLAVVGLGIGQRHRDAVRARASARAAVAEAAASGEPGTAVTQPAAAEPGDARSPTPRPTLGHRIQSAGYGILGGFTTMVANAAGPVMSMYFLASRLSMVAFLGTAAWFYFCVNLVKLPFSISLGLIDGQALLMDLALVPALAGGFLLGRWLVPRMRQQIFERLVVVLSVLGAAYLVLQAITGG